MLCVYVYALVRKSDISTSTRDARAPQEFTIAFLLFGMAIDTIVIGLIGAFIFAQYSNNLQEDCLEETISDVEAIKRAREELGLSKYTEDLDDNLDKLLKDRMLK